jgi:nitrogenase molybdenum-iron protein beta chain
MNLGVSGSKIKKLILVKRGINMSVIERPRFSCALGGALETITSIEGVAPVIHASSGCGGNLFSSQQAGGTYGAGCYGGLAISSTNVGENEIIFGGEERLKEQIASTVEIIDADLYVVVSGCMTEIIGDDIKSAVSDFKDRGVPVIAVATGGFKGNSYKGYDLVLEALFLETVLKKEKINNRVNIWGPVPGKDPFFRGDLAEIKRLLGLIGIEAYTFFGYDETLDDLKSAGEASLNIVLSNIYGLDAAKAFEEKHETPFIIKDLPIGDKATTEFLEEIAEIMAVQKEKVQTVLEKERKQYYKYIERISDLYLDSDLQHYAIVVSNSNYCYSVTRYLMEDIGWLPELSVVTDILSDEEKEIVNKKFTKLNKTRPVQLAFETDSAEIIKHFSSGRTLFTDDRYAHIYSPLFVLGSTHEIDLAVRLGGKSLSISYPVVDRAVLDKGYAGFKGGLHLLEDILNTILLRK